MNTNKKVIAKKHNVHKLLSVSVPMNLMVPNVYTLHQLAMKRLKYLFCLAASAEGEKLPMMVNLTKFILHYFIECGIIIKTDFFDLKRSSCPARLRSKILYAHLIYLFSISHLQTLTLNPCFL